MNEYDSEMMAGLLESMGYEPAADQDDAGILILNTCCVRGTAENKVWGLLGRLKKWKRQREGRILAISGCLPQQPGTSTDICRRFPHVDIVFGTYNRHELPGLIEQVIKERRQVNKVWEKEGEIPEEIPVRRQSGLKAWVPIIHGCNNFCTYCIVPYVRGRERSRRPEKIIAEVQELASQGYREITLLGQNVNSYGKDLEENIDFADLLKELDGIEGLWRIRFMTSHPRDFSEKLIDVIATARKVCEHVHLPAQAGSNRILKAMGRGYTRENYLSLVSKIRKAVPGVAITTDLMVGFPGEAEEDFADTLDLVRRVEYDQAFTFVYNPRKGTPAAKMEQLPEDVKSRRIQKLVALQKEISLLKNKAEEGKVREILVEGPSEHNPTRLCGRTRTNKTVVFEGDDVQVGNLIEVRIVKGHLTHLEGVPVQDEEKR
ncbi:MAG: tRNA (N6-isopentenyl adenosine(37)-C2)-methylthiotransferase MiaB [Peptococcaceae bacterium]|nr:tRNA (N6-isopentenyl adenosine(37)-C2)-methylthiotransferase MiaB [Peptococcaceae bacterium]